MEYDRTIQNLVILLFDNKLQDIFRTSGMEERFNNGERKICDRHLNFLFVTRIIRQKGI